MSVAEDRPESAAPVCGDMGGPHGIGGECVLPPGHHPHQDGIGGSWTDGAAPVDPSASIRAGARAMRELYQSLLRVGFTPEQSLTLVAMMALGTKP